MGLAAYGTHDQKIKSKLANVITFEDDDYSMNPDIFYGEKDEKYTGFPKLLIELFGEPVQQHPGYQFSDYHKDLAFEVQDALEKAILIIAKKAKRETGSGNFCLAGGTFMNCKANGVVAKQDFVDSLFVIPTSSDNGISMGAGLLAAHKDGFDIFKNMEHVYYGPEFTNEEIEETLKQHSKQLGYKKLDDLPKEVGRLISKSKIVAWFQGRMEGGARALGNRSILANPIDPNAKDIVNSRVKFREMWRPFCPSIIEEKSHEYFDIRHPSQFMIIAADAKEGIDELVPSVVHVDNTVRPQEVSKKTNPKYWEAINEFGRISGHPVILNTSFNVKGEPIICRPEEAVKCLLKTDLDYLAIGDYLVWKTGVEYEP
jgi:carbamoyltransferase